MPGDDAGSSLADVTGWDVEGQQPSAGLPTCGFAASTVGVLGTDASSSELVVKVGGMGSMWLGICSDEYDVNHHDSAMHCEFSLSGGTVNTGAALSSDGRQHTTSNALPVALPNEEVRLLRRNNASASSPDGILLEVVYSSGRSLPWPHALSRAFFRAGKKLRVFLRPFRNR